MLGQHPQYEVTVLWIHDKASNKHWNFLTVIEEVLPGQVLAPALEAQAAGKTHPLKQAKLASGQVLLNAFRFWVSDGAMAEHLFHGDGTAGRVITVGGRQLTLHSLGLEQQYPALGSVSVRPPQHVCLGDTASPLQRVLPYRNVTSQAVTKLITQSVQDNQFLEDHLPEISHKAQEWLGIDLHNAQELVGATIWSKPNPYLRSFQISMSQQGKTLIFESYPRPGITCPDMRLTVWGDGPLGSEAYFQSPWHGGAASFLIPNSRGSILVQVHHENGQLLEERRCSFLHTINIQGSISSGARTINAKQADNTYKRVNLTLQSPGLESTIGETDTTLETLSSAQQARERQALQHRGDFLYVSGFEPDAAQHAQDFVRSLLSKVRNRCIVADPYLGAEELESFIAFVTSTAADIVLLTSHAHLRIQADPKNPSGPNEGQKLAQKLQDISRADPIFSPRIVVLEGREAPALHDRFIVADERVYHIGGSLNHLGKRAMAISRVPAPEPVLSDIERWINGEKSQTFESWLSNNG